MIDEYKTLIYESLRKLQARNVDIYTFAIYHDHESSIVTSCVDTLENSKRVFISQNDFSRKHFFNALNQGSINEAQCWLANTGRNLSLGDFSYVNLSVIDAPSGKKTDAFYINMALAIEEMSELINRQSSFGKQLIFCCSTESDEVGLVWSNHCT